MTKIAILLAPIALMAGFNWVVKGLDVMFWATHNLFAMAWNEWAALFNGMPYGDPYGATAVAILSFFAFACCYKWVKA